MDQNQVMKEVWEDANQFFRSGEVTGESVKEKLAEWFKKASRVGYDIGFQAGLQANAKIQEIVSKS